MLKTALDYQSINIIHHLNWDVKSIYTDYKRVILAYDRKNILWKRVFVKIESKLILLGLAVTSASEMEMGI